MIAPDHLTSPIQDLLLASERVSAWKSEEGVFVGVALAATETWVKRLDHALSLTAPQVPRRAAARRQSTEIMSLV